MLSPHSAPESHLFRGASRATPSNRLCLPFRSGGRLYVDRLLDAREHPEQAMRACLGVLRLAGTYGKERLELACERALAAGVASSRSVERLLKADRRHPFLDVGGCACPPSGRVSRWPHPALFAQYSQVRQVSTE
jgi:hypothetical protein